MINDQISHPQTSHGESQTSHRPSSGSSVSYAPSEIPNSRDFSVYPSPPPHGQTQRSPSHATSSVSSTSRVSPQNKLVSVAATIKDWIFHPQKSLREFKTRRSSGARVSPTPPQLPKLLDFPRFSVNFDHIAYPSPPPPRELPEYNSITKAPEKHPNW